MEGSHGATLICRWGVGLLYAAGFRHKTMSPLYLSTSFALFSLPPHSPIFSINFALFLFVDALTFSLALFSLFLFSINLSRLPSPSLFPLYFVRCNNHSALNAMGARGRITMAYSFQSYNTEQLAQRRHSPRTCYSFTAAAGKYSLGSGRLEKSATQAAVVRAAAVKGHCWWRSRRLVFAEL